MRVRAKVYELALLAADGTATRVEPDVALIGSGLLDSLQAVNFRNELRAEFNVNLASDVCFTHPTITDIAELIVGLSKTEAPRGNQPLGRKLRP